jgi:hypothetical protein
MQNKPNFHKAQMNLKFCKKMAYENKHNWTLGQNKPNSNPISNPVKIFLNLPKILNQIDRITSQLVKLGAWVRTTLDDVAVITPVSPKDSLRRSVRFRIDVFDYVTITVRLCVWRTHY